MSTTETIQLTTLKKLDESSSSKIDFSDITHQENSNNDINQKQHDNQDQTTSRFQQYKKVAYALFIRYWFLLGLAIVIGLAWAFPQVGKANGDIEAQYTVKWGAVIVIFLLSGLGLEVSVMLKTILRWRLHLIVQTINFILLPFIMYGIVRFFISVHADLDMTVYKGWMIALSTSTTVSSNAIMTRNANGNDGAGKNFFFFFCEYLSTLILAFYKQHFSMLHWVMYWVFLYLLR